MQSGFKRKTNKEEFHMIKVKNKTVVSKSTPTFLAPHRKAHGRNKSFYTTQNNLDTTQTSLPKPKIQPEKVKTTPQKRRLKIYELRYIAGNILGGRVKSCGQVPIGQEAFYCKKPNSKVFTGGVETCCNANACPICALKVMEQRKLDVYNVLLAFRQHPNVSMGFLTLTVQHQANESYKDVRLKTCKAWLRVRQSKKYRRLEKIFGHIGDIRAVETKISRTSGYHVHQHIAIICDCTAHQLQRFAKCLISLYLLQVNKKVFKGYNQSREKIFVSGYANSLGQNYTPIYNVDGINNYVSKWEVSDELTRSNMKVNGGSKSFTAFGLLNEIHNNVADKEHLNWCEKTFRDYCQSVKSTRSIEISPRLKKYFVKEVGQTELLEYALSFEKTNEEVLEQEAKKIQKEAKVLLTISRKCFMRISKEKIHAHCLNEYEYGEGLIGLQMFLMELGIFTSFDQVMNKLWLDEELINVQIKKTKINLN